MKTYEIDIPVVTYARVRVNGNNPEEAMKSLMKNFEYVDWDYCDEGITELKYMMDCPELYSPKYEFYCYCGDDGDGGDEECYLSWDAHDEKCHVRKEG